jgi:FkbH-like protein
MTSPAYWCRWYRLKDRFADHGLIAVLIAHAADKEWSIDTWLMSCRVIGRDVELFMFRDLLHSARAAGVTHIVARYIPSAKNAPVAQLLPRLGFGAIHETNSYLLDVSTAQLPECKFLYEDPSEIGTATEQSVR